MFETNYDNERVIGIQMFPMYFSGFMIWMVAAVIAIIAFAMNIDIPCTVDNPGISELVLLIFELVYIPCEILIFILWYLFLFTGNNHAYNVVNISNVCFELVSSVFMVFALLILINEQYQCPNYRLMSIYIIVRYVVSPVFNLLSNIIGCVIRCKVLSEPINMEP